MHYTHLPQRGLIRLFGEETIPFLQGLVSNDVTRLGHGAHYAALLSPQGKFLHDFFMVGVDDAIVIDCEKARLPDLLQRLKMYRLRSKVTIEPMADTVGVAVIWDVPENVELQAQEIKLVRDPRVAALGWRVIGDVAAIDAWCKEQSIKEADADAYDRMRLEIGVPDGSRDMIPDKSFPLQFGFEDLHGVDFKKGCYVGQEVTARTKHLGQVRKFIYKVQAINGVLPPEGTPVHLGEILAGELRSSVGSDGLALLQVADVEKARSGNGDLRCGDIMLKATLPAWVKQLPSGV